MRPIRLMIVDDNQDDIALLTESFSRRNASLECLTASDGMEAIEKLRDRRDTAPSALPDLILLDLNMPRMDGREFLTVAKADNRIGRIPVVVLTSSASDADVLRAYQAHANGYLVKPSDLDELHQIVELIDHYWLRASSLPQS